MKTVIRRVLFAAVLGLTIPGTLPATPNAAAWVRETLIGANAEHYFSYIFERHQPGSYYAFTDVFRLCTFSLRDGSLVEDTTLCRTAYGACCRTHGCGGCISWFFLLLSGLWKDKPEIESGLQVHWEKSWV